MSKVEFNIGDWRNKHIVKEGVGGVISRNPFGRMDGMFRTEAIDHIDDEEADQEYDENESEEMSDEEFNIQEWQKRFLDKRNLKWG